MSYSNREEEEEKKKSMQDMKHQQTLHLNPKQTYLLNEVQNCVHYHSFLMVLLLQLCLPVAMSLV